MSKAYRRLTLSERQSLREKCKKELLYVMIYEPLWHQRGGDLSPEDVWIEALLLAKEMRGEKAFYARMRVAETIEDLCERYACFEDDHGGLTIRSEGEAMHSAMMVVLTAFFMLLNETEDLDANPNRFICKALKDAVRDVVGFREIYEGARKEEDALEYSGRFIEACNIVERFASMTFVSETDIQHLHEVMGLLVDETKKSTLPTMQEQERLFARVNEQTNGAITKELNDLRHELDLRATQDTPKTLSLDTLGFAVKDVQTLFWSQSSWAVVFCVCRDRFKGTTNASQFERDVQTMAEIHKFNYTCPLGTISRTISNNPYMKKPVDKWSAPDVPKRVLSLKESLISAMENTI